MKQQQKTNHFPPSHGFWIFPNLPSHLWHCMSSILTLVINLISQISDEDDFHVLILDINYHHPGFSFFFLFLPQFYHNPMYSFPLVIFFFYYISSGSAWISGIINYHLSKTCLSDTIIQFFVAKHILGKRQLLTIFICNLHIRELNHSGKARPFCRNINILRMLENCEIPRSMS